MSDKAVISTELVDNLLRIDVERDGNTIGVELKLSGDDEDVKALNAACSMLMSLLAGVHETELFLAGSKAIMEIA